VSGPPDETGSDWPHSDLPADAGDDAAYRNEPAAPVEPPPPTGAPPSPTDPPPPPSEELSPGESEHASPEIEAGEVTTSGGWDPRLHGERRRPTTAEQAVPWLIGLILALAGVCIVLLALIFTGPEGLVSENPSATPSSSGVASPSTAVTTPSPSVPATPDTTPSPPPTFGPLEMVYLGIPPSGGELTVLRRDFSTKTAAAPVAALYTAPTKTAWAPDGRIGAVIVGGSIVALAPGVSARTISDHITAMAFADDSTTLYALRITSAGTNDQAEVLAIDGYAGTSRTVATMTYEHPVTFPDPPLTESQFADNGGLDRIYATVDGFVVVWILAAPDIYRIDPVDGAINSASREPVLWSPDQSKRIDVESVTAGKDRLVLRDHAGTTLASISLGGLASHVRWALTNNEVVFTLGTYGPGSVVQQNLYVWDLTDGKAPSPLTSDNTSRAAEWLGVPQAWLP
jgi:hypothetical protein